jgi:hypothetical protein
MARNGYRQAKPVDRPLDYFSQYSTAQTIGHYISAYGATDQHDYFPGAYSEANYKAAYEKMREKVNEKTLQLGASLGEYNQTRKMLVDSCVTLFGTAKAISRGDFGGAARLLRKKYVPKGASIFKTLGQNWLEFHFGWEPLVKDVYTAMEILSQPLPAFHYKGSVKDSYVKELDSSVDPPYNTNKTVLAHNCVFYIGAEFAVTNPNLNMLEISGLTNPASVAWELVPFSFVVDWFVDVGDCLRRFTDFLGCTVTGQYHGRKFVIDWTRDCKIFPRPLPASQFPPQIQVISGKHVIANRRAGWPAFLYAPSIKIPKQWSLSRGATAASLLAQGLGRNANVTPQRMRRDPRAYTLWNDIHAPKHG